jgi:hypothetical protein
MGQAAKEAPITIFNTKEIGWGTLTTAGSSKNGFHVNLGKFMHVFSFCRRHLFPSALTHHRP